METATVGPHWIHERFAENLINASHARELSEAAEEWQLDRFGHSEVALSCHVCNTAIKLHVVLRNSVNENRLIIGNDCYDKLLGFLASGRVESQLPKRSDTVRELKGYLRKIVPDKTVVGWLTERLDADEIGDSVVAEIVRLIKRLGFAPTYEDADRVVEYYKATRKHPITSLIRAWRLAEFRYKRFLPEEITICDIPRIERLLATDSGIRFHHRWNQKKAEMEAKLKEAKKLILRVSLEAPHLLEDFKDSLRVAEEELDSASCSSDKFSYGIPLYSVQKFLRDAMVRVSGWLNAPQREAVLVPGDSPYILVKDWDGRWRPHYAEILGSVPTDICLCRVRLLGDRLVALGDAAISYRRRFQRLETIAVVEKLASAEVIREVNFFTPSDRDKDSFVGRLNGKIVLPNTAIRKKGKYLCFLMGDTGRFFRAWVIKRQDD